MFTYWVLALAQEKYFFVFTAGTNHICQELLGGKTGFEVF